MIPFASPLLHVAAITAGPVPTGQALFTASGSYIVPAGVTEICVVTISWGGAWNGPFGWSGAGGGLSYKNVIPTTPGEVLTVDLSYGGGWIVGLFRGSTPLCTAQNADSSTPGKPIVGTGFSGGGSNTANNGGGGGAGGYTGPGGDSQAYQGNGGGGSSPYGGTLGAAGAPNGSSNSDGSPYGGGAGNYGQPGGACVRIIHGPGRAFPNTNTEDMAA